MPLLNLFKLAYLKPVSTNIVDTGEMLLYAASDHGLQWLL